ncbi:MAG: DedA family protein [Candidatus Gastranaerophilales bacterium]|nr:DedA family protein [Candidatus Gastranaerophilales bacterium]
MNGIIEFFKQCAIYFMEMGEIGLFALSFMESSFFPIPPDVVLIPMCLANPEQALFYATIATVGSALGGIFGYAIGKFGGRPALFFLFRKQYKKIKDIEKLYNKYGVWAVGAAAFTPIPYKIFTIASGIFDMNLLGFSLVSIIGRGLRFFIIATALLLFGEAIKENLEWIILGISVLIIIFYIIVCKWKVIKEKFQNK